MRPLRSSIGGQAVIEGVMMRGHSSMATAVRGPNGEITMETARFKTAKEKGFFYRAPFFRGIFNFSAQMFSGTALLMRSAEVYGDFQETTKFEDWFSKKFKTSSLNLVLAISVILGIALAIGLFVFLPNLLAGLFFSIPALSNAHPVLYSLTEGLLMIVIFVLYVVIVSAMKDIRRVFMYHGAEHKTINCYELGYELTVENAKKMSKAHSRCGTTFMFIVLVVSILLFSLVNWGMDALGWKTDKAILNSLIKIPAKLVFVPIVAGISYELLKLLSKSDCLFVRILRSPGSLLQKLTTREPSDDMLECSIAAFKEVQTLEEDGSLPLKKFNVAVPYPVARGRIEKILKNRDKSDIDWIFVEATGKKRSELESLKMLSGLEFDKAERIANKMTSGMPLQYALGYTEFYGLKLKVDSCVLIPRPETELLAETAIAAIKNEKKKVLELCSGSGAVALAVKQNSNAEVYASDISEKAVSLANANAKELNLNVEFVVSDLFQKWQGQKFDLIVCNPPYIKSEDIFKLENTVKDFEPTLALDGGKDGLDFYKRIRAEFQNYLLKGGALILEIGEAQGKDIKDLFDGFRVEMKKDYCGKDRIVTVFNEN